MIYKEVELRIPINEISHFKEESLIIIKINYNNGSIFVSEDMFISGVIGNGKMEHFDIEYIPGENTKVTIKYHMFKKPKRKVG